MPSRSGPRTPRTSTPELAAARAGGERLALDDRHRRLHAGHRGDALGHRVVVGEVARRSAAR